MMFYTHNLWKNNLNEYFSFTLFKFRYQSIIKRYYTSDMYFLTLLNFRFTLERRRK